MVSRRVFLLILIQPIRRRCEYIIIEIKLVHSSKPYFDYNKSHVENLALDEIFYLWKFIFNSIGKGRLCVSHIYRRSARRIYFGPT